MGNDWRLVKLGDLIDITHGYAFKGEFFCDEPQRDILLTPGNFAIGGGFKPDKFKYYVGEIPKDYILKEGDLIVTMTDLSKSADTLGYPAIIPKIPKNWNFLHNQRLGKVIINQKSQVDKNFLYYQLRTDNYRHEILVSATGSTVKHTSPNRIKEYCFYLPPLPEQKAIAHILGTLDDKIELNRRMNQTLENIARAIFKSWFIDFDPVKAKMEGREPVGMSKEIADLFPDSFVDSELGMIPKGWRIGTLGNIAKNFCRAIRTDNIDPNTHYIGLEHMPRYSIALSHWGKAKDINSNKYQFYQGEILFGKLRSYFHKVGIAPLNGICSTDILVINPNFPEWLGFTLLIVSTDDFINYTDTTSTGTRMPRTSWKNMAKYQIIIPPFEIAKLFNEQVKTFLKKINVNIFESRTIANIRDTLLPKLISGEIRIKKAEKMV